MRSGEDRNTRASGARGAKDEHHSNIAVTFSSLTPPSSARHSLEWREWLTDQTLHLYTQKKVYYNLAEVDNPDQRIAQDVASFTGFSLALGITLITSVVDLASFSYILYR